MICPKDHEGCKNFQRSQTRDSQSDQKDIETAIFFQDLTL